MNSKPAVLKNSTSPCRCTTLSNGAAPDAVSLIRITSPTSRPGPSTTMSLPTTNAFAGVSVIAPGSSTVTVTCVLIIVLRTAGKM